MEKVVYIFIKKFTEEDVNKLLSSEMAKKLFSEFYEVYMKQPRSVTALFGILLPSYNELNPSDIKDLFKGFLTPEYLVIFEKVDGAGLEEGDDYLDYWFNSGDTIKHSTSSYQEGIEDVYDELYGMCREIRDLWLNDDLSGKEC